MPTYQYACTACDERLEAVQTFTDAPLSDCPACSGRLRKVFSAVGVVFKGSGFYKTDSRDSKKPAAAGATAEGGASGKDSGSKDSGSKESSGSKDSGSKESSGSKDSGGSSGSSSTPAAASSSSSSASSSSSPASKTA